MKNTYYIVLEANNKYHLCTKKINEKKAKKLIIDFRKILKNFKFSIMSRKYHIQTQWDNRKLNF